MLARLRQALSLSPASPEAMSLASYSRASTPALAVAAVAGRQWGVISRAQLIARGVSGSVISRWVRDGRLIRLYPGVYAVGHASLSYEGRLVAALFAVGTGAGLSDVTAMHWWQFHERQPDHIHVSVPSRRRAPGPGVVVHHPRELTVVRHRRLMVTPPAETLRSYASHSSVRDVRKALAQADFQRQFNPVAIRAEIGRGRPGSKVLGEALDRHLPQLAEAATELEVEFLLLCEKFEIPLPQMNVWIDNKKVDALWSDLRLIVELDSELAHGTEARRLADRQRDLELRGLGYTIRRYTWHQIVHRPAEVAADLRAAIAAAT